MLHADFDHIRVPTIMQMQKEPESLRRHFLRKRRYQSRQEIKLFDWIRADALKMVKEASPVPDKLDKGNLDQFVYQGFIQNFGK